AVVPTIAVRLTNSVSVVRLSHPQTPDSNHRARPPRARSAPVAVARITAVRPRNSVSASRLPSQAMPHSVRKARVHHRNAEQGRVIPLVLTGEQVLPARAGGAVMATSLKFASSAKSAARQTAG